MRRRRLTELLVGHALAEGSSVADALRHSGGAPAIAGAAEVDAGDLIAGLRTARVADELAELGAAWPAAVGPARRRLDRRPDLFVKKVQLLEMLAYLYLVAGIQALALVALTRRPLDVAIQNIDGVAPGGLAWLPSVLGGLVVVEFGLLAAGVATLWFPRLVPGWGRSRRRSTVAAMAAALDESKAPAPVRQRLLAAWGTARHHEGTAADLDVVLESAIATEAAAHQRLLTGVRGVGLGTLTAAALVTTWAVYRLIAWIPQ